MGRRFRADFVIRLTIERTSDDTDDPTSRGLLHWALIGLAVVGIVAVFTYRHWTGHTL